MKNIMTLLLCTLVGAVVGGIGAYALAPLEPDPAVVVPGVDMSQYRVTGGDTPTWGTPVITMSIVNDHGGVRGLELIVRNGNAEFHDYNVRLKNSESITRFVDFGVPIGVAAGLLAGIMIAQATGRKQIAK
jgi:hypothetical protein